MAFGAPAQHAAREVGDFLEARLLEDQSRLRRATASATHRHDGPCLVELSAARLQLAKRNELGPADAPERPAELVGLAHVDDLNEAVFFQPGGLYLPHPGEGTGQRGP